MIKKIFTGVIAGAILVQATVGPIYITANAVETQTETKQADITMQAKAENTGLDNNEVVIQNTVEGQNYTLTLPEQLQLDTSKIAENITYNKTKNEVTIKGTGEKVSLFLIATKEGSYKLDLKENTKVTATLDLIVQKQEDNTDEIKNIIASKPLKAGLLAGSAISDKLSLQAEGSKTTLNNYTEQMTISYSINFLDGGATLKDGKLVVDFTGSGLEPVNYPKSSAANANVKSASYSSSTDKLTINLADNIPSGAPFDIPVVVRASYDAVPGTTMDLKATLSGANNSGDTYNPVDKAISYMLAISGDNKVYEPITAGDGSWDFANRNISFSLAPGGYHIVWPVLNKISTENKSFKNLKIEYLKENGAEAFDFRLGNLNIIQSGAYWSSLSDINGSPIQISDTAEKK